MRDTVAHAMILAAGFGTRLRPFTLETPKPLLEVLGRPLIHYALAHAKRAGCERVVINTHHLGAQIEAALGDTFADMALHYSHEDTILGTGGGIRRMADKLDLDQGPFLILNSDALCDFDVRGLVAAHHQSGPIGTMLLKATDDMDSYGTLGVDDQGRVVRFVDRARAAGDEVRRGMFLGAHVMDPKLLDYLPPDVESCVNTVGYPRALEDGHGVQGVFTTGSFSDVGTPGRLMQAHRDLLDGTFGHAYLDVPAASGGPGVAAPSVVAAGVRIGAGAQIGPRAALGPGAVVGDGAQVVDSILFSGARVAPGEVVRAEIRSAAHRVVVGEGTK